MSEGTLKLFICFLYSWYRCSRVSGGCPGANLVLTRIPRQRVFGPRGLVGGLHGRVGRRRLWILLRLLRSTDIVKVGGRRGGGLPFGSLRKYCADTPWLAPR